MKANTDKNETKSFPIYTEATKFMGESKVKNIFQGRWLTNVLEIIKSALTKSILIGPNIILKNFPKNFHLMFKILKPKVYKTDRLVYNHLLQLINVEIQRAFRVSQPIRPFQVILGERVNDLDMLKPEKNKFYLQWWCVLCHPHKQNDKLADERREEATKEIKYFGITIWNSEQVRQLSFLIS